MPGKQTEKASLSDVSALLESFSCTNATHASPSTRSFVWASAKLARSPDSHTQSKFARACQIMRGDFAKMRTPQRTARNERVRGTIAQALLDRGWGKPKVEVVNEGGGGYLEELGQANHTGSCL